MLLLDPLGQLFQPGPCGGIIALAIEGFGDPKLGDPPPLAVGKLLQRAP